MGLRGGPLGEGREGRSAIARICLAGRAWGQLGPAGARFGLIWPVETRTTPPGRRGLFRKIGRSFDGATSLTTDHALGGRYVGPQAPPLLSLELD